LWSKYPDEIYINGKYVSLKNISKRFISLDQFYFWYASTIGHSIDKHNQIIQILDWAKSNELIHISIIEFVASQKWLEFKSMKENGIKGSAHTYDVYDSVY
jgi:hypothetical protein